MKSRLSGLLLLIVVAAVALLGCGGGGSSSSGSTGSAGGGELTKAELISKGDQICTETQEKTDPIKQEFEEVFEGGETQKALVEGAEIFRKAVPLVGAEAEALRELEPPSADAATINKMLDDLEESSEPLEGMAAAVEGDEEAKLKGVEKEIEGPNRRATAIAKAYGFKVCGEEETT
jgi:hypothetical protein